MSVKRVLGIICFALAAWFFVAGLVTTMRGPGLFHPSGLGISQAVGAFLPCVIVLIVGLWLFKKPGRGGSA